MIKINNLLVAFCAGAFTVLSLSMSPTVHSGPQAQLSDFLTHTDTISQNDSMFSILNFDKGKLTKIELKQYINSRKNRSFGIHTISFYNSGRIQLLKSNCRDTVLSNGKVAYEEQMLIFDSLNRISEYQIMSDFQIICKNDKN